MRTAGGIPETLGAAIKLLDADFCTEICAPNHGADGVQEPANVVDAESI